jgi:hypothetical protein
MAYAIQAQVNDPRSRTFALTAHETMCGGTRIAIALMAFAMSVLSVGAAAASEVRVLALQSPQTAIAA